MSRSTQHRSPREVLKFVAHGRRVISLAAEHGWRPGARYTNLRDVRHVSFSGFGFLDIHWKRYSFDRHLDAARRTRPFATVARDIECVTQFEQVISEARLLQRFASKVIIVPKDPRLEKCLRHDILEGFWLGYSVPTKYGGTTICPSAFTRPVHLLGGRPDTQRRLAELMPVVSFDCNRFTYDARYGDYFDGTAFRPLPSGGYEECLRASLANINELWADYRNG